MPLAAPTAILYRDGQSKTFSFDLPAVLSNLGQKYVLYHLRSFRETEGFDIYTYHVDKHTDFH